ncbi:MAG TPA: tRNA (adenosine(37)-N6)-threonylcarbamoyltransferase complex ATPase subunit type 1 TsaE [Gemmatimonadales bacterium]
MTRVVREADLPGLAAELVAALPPHAVLWLTGGLGAGKTTLARAVVAALGAAAPATSPTFGLVHRYRTEAGPVFHVDCYRLRSPEEASEIDWAELEEGRLLMVEWPDRGGGWVPRPDLTLRLEPGPGPGTRVIHWAAGEGA